MRERPILFSGPMVRAIIAGRKTQTRRVVRHRHGIRFLGGRGQEADPSLWGYAFDGPDHHGYMVVGRGLDERHDHGRISLPCPYGSPGDRLWVRETWHPSARIGLDVEVEYRADESTMERRWDGRGDVDVMISRSAWRSSLHMPRWASRLTLAVESVRVERLCAITEDDARAEGVGSVEEYRALWGSIHCPAAWQADPWVWVVGFGVLS